LWYHDLTSLDTIEQCSDLERIYIDTAEIFTERLS
jgi:hypothetical protein